MFQNDEYWAETSFARYTTKNGVLNGLLAEARKHGDGPPYEERKGKGRFPARVYKKKDVFEWVEKLGLKCWRHKRISEIREEERMEQHSNLSAFADRLLIAQIEKLNIEMGKLRGENEIIRKELARRTIGRDDEGLLNQGEILARGQSFDNGCGVYFLISDNEIVYVGQSINIWARLGTHFAEGLKQFDSVAYVLLDKNDLNLMEAAYIRKFQPKYNKQCNTVTPLKGANNG